MKSSINNLFTGVIVLSSYAFLASCGFQKRGCDTPGIAITFKGFNDSTDVIVGKYEKGSNFSKVVSVDTLDSIECQEGSYGTRCYDISEHFDWKFSFPEEAKEYTIAGIRFEDWEAGPNREDGCRDVTYYTLNGIEQRVGSMSALSAVVPPVFIELEK